MRLILITFYIFAATLAQATPMYYVFETKVLNTYDDFEYNIGDSINHIFKVDRDHGEYNVENHWYTYEMEFLGGPIFQADKAPFTGGIENESFARDIPANLDYQTEATTQFFYSSDNFALELYTNHPYHDGFLLSQNFDEYGEPTAYFIDLKLDNISVFSENPMPTPVPEPATVFLFSVGLAGVAHIRNRRKNRSSGKM